MDNTKLIMIKNGAESFIFDGQLHYKVEDVKKFLPDMKIDTTKIVEHHHNGKIENVIAQSYIQPMTEFDKKIAQTFNFNPNK